MPYLGISVNFANIGIQNLEDAENRGQSQWKPNLTTMKKNFLLALLALTACLSCTAPKQENTAPAETQTEKALPSEFKPLATPLQKDKFIQINRFGRRHHSFCLFMQKPKPRSIGSLAK